MKAKKVVDDNGYFIGIRIDCPGCGGKHVLPTGPLPHGEVQSPPYVNSARWHFNGDYEKPTLSPSVHVKRGHYAYDQTVKGNCWCTYNEEHPDDPNPFTCSSCHSFIRNGMIEFLNDCSHALAGQTVELPDIE